MDTAINLFGIIATGLLFGLSIGAGTHIAGRLNAAMLEHRYRKQMPPRERYDPRRQTPPPKPRC